MAYSLHVLSKLHFTLYMLVPLDRNHASIPTTPDTNGNYWSINDVDLLSLLHSPMAHESTKTARLVESHMDQGDEYTININYQF